MLAVMLAFILITDRFFNIRYDYTLLIVAAGGSILGLLSGVIGSFAVLRQQSLMGDALSHAALPGVAIAFMLVGRQMGALLIGAAIASWLGAQFIRAVTSTTRIKQDAAMGITLAAWFALGLALLTVIQGQQDASQAGLAHFIFGQAASIRLDTLLTVAAAGGVILLITALFWKELKLLTFDPVFASTVMRTQPVEALLSTLIVAVIVMGLQVAGVILMVGLLIAPAVAARQWSRRLDQMVILAGLFGAFAGGSGAIISATDSGLPTGPLIIIMASIVVAISLLFAPERGIVWTVWKQRRERISLARRNVLLALYRHAQSHGDNYATTPEDLITGLYDGEGKRALHWLEQHDQVVKSGVRWQLTTAGVTAAEAALNAHAPLSTEAGRLN
jgi:manganese/zinc/iron transport system permease protein